MKIADGLNSENIKKTQLSDLAFATFQNMRVPEKKQEAWRFSSRDLPYLLQKEFDFANETEEGKIFDRSFLFQAKTETLKFVFVNGHYQAHLSDITGLPQGILVTTIKNAMQQDENINLFALQPKYENFFSALNGGLLDDGLFIRIPSEMHVDIPLHLIYLNTQKDIITNPRHVLVIEKNASVSFIEEYCSQDESFTNPVTLLTLMPYARLQYYKLQDEHPNAYHIATTQVIQNNSSSFNALHLNQGAKYARDNLYVDLKENESHCELRGLYLLKANQFSDYHTHIEHAGEKTQSEQCYRGILKDQAHGVFNGSINVLSSALNASAKQMNQNILLSEHCKINSKPELAIDTDAIQCSHGATVGSLSEDEIFYLRSRGLSFEQAEQLLLKGFITELLDAIQDITIKNYFMQRLVI